MASRHRGIIASGGPGQPGHSFCACSPHFPKAPCAALVDPSLVAWPSLQVSAASQRAYAGRPLVFWYSLMVATQISAAPFPVVPLVPPVSPLVPLVPDED